MYMQFLDVHAQVDSKILGSFIIFKVLTYVLLGRDETVRIFSKNLSQTVTKRNLPNLLVRYGRAGSVPTLFVILNQIWDRYIQHL